MQVIVQGLLFDICWLVDCSVGFRTGGACGLRMLAFYRSVPSFPLSPSHSPPTLPPLLILLFLTHRPSPSRECRRRGAAGQLRRRLGSGGAATTPGTALGPGAATPEAGPGSPAPRPARPTTPTCHPLDSRMPEISGVSVGGDRMGRARGGPGEGEVWRRWDTLKMCSGWASM